MAAEIELDFDPPVRASYDGMAWHSTDELVQETLDTWSKLRTRMFYAPNRIMEEAQSACDEFGGRIVSEHAQPSDGALEEPGMTP